MPEEKVTLDVFRYRPDDGAEPVFERFEAPYDEHWVVLDALNWVKDNVDGSLSFRWSCRMGVCGSCGMMVNGEAMLTCAAFLRDYLGAPIRIEPLANFPVERDLIVSLDGFMDKLKSVEPWIIRKDETPPKREYLQTPAEHARYKQFSMCINCMLCYAACPEIAGEPHFLGPAAIALAHRYNLDTRDQGADRRLAVLGSDEGLWDCTFVGECSKVCPKHVDPAAAIQQAKVETTKDWYKQFLLPRAKA